MIRSIAKYLKHVSLLLSVAFLIQGCKAYEKKSVSIDEAIGNDIKRVKIITQDDQKYVYDSIYYKDEVLKGILITDKNTKIKRLEISINPDDIKEIHLYNKGKSAAMTVLLVLGIPVAILGISIGIWVAQGTPIGLD